MHARILIADDHEVVRRGIRAILEERPEWEICGEARNGLDAIRLARELKPDAIVLDVTMPLMSGLRAAHEISQEQPGCKLLMFTMHESKTLAEFAQQSGAHGLVAKNRALDELIQALDDVLAGRTYFRRNGEPVTLEK